MNHYELAVQDLNRAIQIRRTPAYIFTRGWTYFLQSNFKQASADFTESLLLAKDTRDQEWTAISLLWLYLAQQRAGLDGRQQLQAYVKELAAESWRRSVAELFLGFTTPRAVRDKLNGLGLHGDNLALGEAFFYLGQYYLLTSKRLEAAEMFRAVLKDGSPSALEHRASLVELQRMGFSQ